ncbi:class I ribonucleotide reductase maintenance protein YfaE [Thiotrichales bacterium 19S9-12]|nr:class I ribonucleotide reductase maintenance protein YfaE [Thiotrichales bacterium 19S9-11]MCF6811220.1 class I ribonucleotide reductase maintenance protein YfaE [Thiotrichales bacterium 19S9-12]
MPKLKYNDQIIDFSDKNKTILELLEQSEIKVNFQCRNGICGTCRCKLLKGSAEYKILPLAMTRSDEILICIAHLSDDGEIRSL